MEKKINFSLLNFGKNNTPAVWQKIGDACLIIAGCGGVIATLPLSAPVVTAISSYLAVAGVVGKIITKLTGNQEPAK
tara:strand:- start:24183 stop:24413 length:231 start_codon:yes stop_codon:yes gene_type:complete